MQKLSNDECIATSGSFKNNELEQRIITTCKSLNRASKSKIVKIFSTQGTSNRYVEVFLSSLEFLLHTKFQKKSWILWKKI